MLTRASIEIDAMPRDVWPWLVEPDRIPRWWTRVKSLETQDGGPLREGARFTVVQAWREGDRTYDGEVIACRAPELLEYRVVRSPPGASSEALRVRVKLVGFGRPTVVEYESDLEWPANVPRILKPLLWLLVRQGEKQHLRPLKAIVESGEGLPQRE